jgi:recombination protein RecA
MRIATPSRNGHAPALVQTLHTLQRRFGPEVIAPLPAKPPAVIPTGFPALDQALGIGGLPRGRIVDIYGPESGGKSTLCLHVIAQAQRQGGSALFIDVEHGLDLAWARRCGVDTEALYVSQPDTAEIAFEIVEAMARAGISLIVIDSAAALTPRAEVETDMGDHHPGLMAGLMSQALRKLTGPLHRGQTLLLLTNQLRSQAAVANSPEAPTGGRALRHYAAVRLELHPERLLRQRGQVVGRRIRATVTKSKVAPPYRTANLDIWHEAAR